jgi:hypothetical protein
VRRKVFGRNKLLSRLEHVFCKLFYVEPQVPLVIRISKSKIEIEPVDVRNDASCHN